MKNIISKIIFGAFLPTLIFVAGPAFAEIIEGFPEGCSYASIQQPLPDHQLRFGRIHFEGSVWVFSFVDQFTPGPLLMTPVAENLGLIGADPSQYFGIDLRAITPFENYIIAQVLNRDIIGLPPIVTCISRIFMGAVNAFSPIPYGPDYYGEIERVRNYRFDHHKRERWDKWRKNRDDIRVIWKKIQNKRKRQKAIDRRRALDPEPRIYEKWTRKSAAGRVRLSPEQVQEENVKARKRMRLDKNQESKHGYLSDFTRHARKSQFEVPLKKQDENIIDKEKITRIKLDDDDDNVPHHDNNDNPKKKWPQTGITKAMGLIESTLKTQKRKQILIR